MRLVESDIGDRPRCLGRGADRHAAAAGGSAYRESTRRGRGAGTGGVNLQGDIVSVLDTSNLLWPRKKPFARATHDVWRPSAVAVAGPELADRVDPIRRLTFYAGLLLLLVKFAMLPELLSLLFCFNTYVLYIVGIPAAVGIIVSGGVRRTVAGLPAWVWISFACWMVLCAPFSSWKAGSPDLVKVFVPEDIMLMIAIAGLMV